MTDFLHSMAVASRARAQRVQRDYTDDALDRPVFALELAGFDLIAEIKRQSPSEGPLAAAGDDCDSRGREYAQAGAAAISVLTEPNRFAGEIGHLESVSRAVADLGVPVMRKDFLVDTAQVLEARAAGASGVLLIAAILDDALLADMLACAFEHSLFVLLEAFDDEDVTRCCRLLEKSSHAEAAAKRELLLGINCRDLKTLNVDWARFERYADRFPDGVLVVAESGLHDATRAAQVADLGYAMALVGSALMRARVPGDVIRAMLAAGRAS